MGWAKGSTVNPGEILKDTTDTLAIYENDESVCISWSKSRYYKEMIINYWVPFPFQQYSHHQDVYICFYLASLPLPLFIHDLPEYTLG